MNTLLKLSSWDDMVSWMESALSLGYGYYPKVDVLDETDKLVFECAVPGLKKEDISVTLDNGVLTIKSESVSEKSTIVLKELHKSSFSRSFSLKGYNLDENPDCKMQDGILSVSFKKTGDNKSTVKKIEIQ